MTAIRLFAGSVFGTARELALDIEEALEDEGLEVTFFPEPTLEDFTGGEPDSAVLVVTATTGEGELPGNLLPLYQQLEETLPIAPERPCGLIALGDSAYQDSFCGAGDQMEALFDQLRYRPVKETLRIDAGLTPDPASQALPWAMEWAELVNSR